MRKICIKFLNKGILCIIYSSTFFVIGGSLDYLCVVMTLEGRVELSDPMNLRVWKLIFLFYTIKLFVSKCQAFNKLADN